jgi:acyl carrier protein
VSALPERSHPVDRWSAAHFTQVLEKDRHWFQPVTVAVDHRMVEAGVYSSGAIFLSSRLLSCRFFYNRLVAYTPPQTALEEKLSRIWSDVLEIEPVGIHDSFFELGGDSLRATKIVVRILKELRAEIALKTLFNSPTIVQVAMEISTHHAGHTEDAKVAALLEQIESLSDEEVGEWVQRDHG